MKMRVSEYHALLRQDLYAFIEKAFCELNPATAFQHNWHIEVIAAELEACRRGNTKRLIISIPTRSLKSICASVAFPAWLMGHEPSSQIIAQATPRILRISTRWMAARSSRVNGIKVSSLPGWRVIGRPFKNS